MDDATSAPGSEAGDNLRQQTSRGELAVRVDQSKRTRSYANAFRTNGTTEEVTIDFGVNTAVPDAEQPDRPAVLFEVEHQVVMNYYSAKRLAMSLADVLRRYEADFGEVELNPAKRQPPRA